MFKWSLHILIRLVFQKNRACYMKMQFFVLWYELMLFYNPHWWLNMINFFPNSKFYQIILPSVSKWIKNFIETFSIPKPLNEKSRQWLYLMVILLYGNVSSQNLNTSDTPPHWHPNIRISHDLILLFFCLFS